MSSRGLVKKTAQFLWGFAQRDLVSAEHSVCTHSEQNRQTTEQKGTWIYSLVSILWIYRRIDLQCTSGFRDWEPWQTNISPSLCVSSCRWDEQSVCDQHKGESQRLWEMWARQKKNNNQKWEKNQTIKPDRKQKTTNNIIQLYCNVWQTEWRLQKAVMRARQTNRKTNKLHLRTNMAIRCPGGRGWLRQWSLGGNLLFQRCSQSFFHCQDHAQKWYIYEQMLYLGNAITAKKTTKVKSSCLTHKENSKMLRGFGTGFIEMLLVMCNNKLLGNFEQQPALQTKDVSLLYCDMVT